MYSAQAESPLIAFFRKCYELGNTPILGTGKKPSKASANAQKAVRERLQTHSKTSQDSLARFTDQGVVKANPSGGFTLNGEDFHVDQNTWVVGTFAPGDEVRIVGVVKSGVGRYATKVSIVKKLS